MRGMPPVRQQFPLFEWACATSYPALGLDLDQERRIDLQSLRQPTDDHDRSTDIRSFAALLCLPSSRVSLGWAQDVLFPDAEAGKRIVICMRSAAYWGLEQGQKY